MKTPRVKNVNQKTATKRKNLKTNSLKKTRNNNSTVSKNLIKKFEITKSNKKNLKEIFENFEKTEDVSGNKINNKSSIILTNEKMFNELLNRLNKYKQVINFHEELNNQYINEVQQFINYFMNYFNKYANNEDKKINHIRESFLRLEHMILSNYDISGKDENYKNSLDYLFNILSENLEQTKNENVNENDGSDNLQDFESRKNKMIAMIGEIKNYANTLADKLKKKLNSNSNLNLENINEDNSSNISDNFNSDLSNNFHSNFSQLARNKLKNSFCKREKLLETVQIKKSKERYGEGDEIIQDKEIILDDDIKSVSTNNLKKIIEKSIKVFLRNFLQIYLIKENGIFSESYFSKVDRNCLSAYKNFKFYEIKIYFNILEHTEDIEKYILTLRKLFTCHIMTYNTLHYSPHKKIRFTKISISGVGKKQSLMKRNLINFMSEDVKLDCLIKISLFSNIFDCMSNSLKKIYKKENFFFYTNINDSMLSKIMSRIKLDTKEENERENLDSE